MASQPESWCPGAMVMSTGSSFPARFSWSSGIASPGCPSRTRRRATWVLLSSVMWRSPAIWMGRNRSRSLRRSSTVSGPEWVSATGFRKRMPVLQTPSGLRAAMDTLRTGTASCMASVEVVLQVALAGQGPQLALGPFFDLADPFTGEPQAPAHLLQRHGILRAQTVAEMDDLALAGAQLLHHALHVFPQPRADQLLVRRGGGALLVEAEQQALLVLQLVVQRGAGGLDAQDVLQVLRGHAQFARHLRV